MSTVEHRPLLRLHYEEAAEAYLRSLPPEHFMEAEAQATQRKITLESLDVLTTRRPDVQVFNELLVQYPWGRQQKLRHVVPDNMVVIHEKRIKAGTSFKVPFQPVPPFWMLEYVSKSNRRKDYEDNFERYERELKVRYYLLFYPDEQELTLYKHTGRKYRAVPPNDNNRHPIEELDLELGLLDGWVRFWYKGKLLPLTADLQREVDEQSRLLQEAIQRAEQEKQRAEREMQRAEQEKQRAEEYRAQLDQVRETQHALERELERLRARNGSRSQRPPGNH